MTVTRFATVLLTAVFMWQPVVADDRLRIISGGNTLTMDHQAAGVISNGLLFTSGIIGMDPETRKYASLEIEGQARQAFENLKAVLEKAGTSPSNVVQITVYLAGIEYFQPMNAMYIEVFGEHTPARTIMGFTPWDENFLIQLEAVAAVPQ